MTPEDIQICEKGLRSIVNTYGRLVAKANDGRALDSGTAVFIKVDNVPLITSAQHVVSGLSKKGSIYLQVFREWAAGTSGLMSPPTEFIIDPGSCLDLPRNKLLDIIALRPPFDVSSSPLIKWFDGGRHAEAMQYFREEIPKTKEPWLAGMLVGFPRFARFEDILLHIEPAGSIAIWALLHNVSDPPEVLGLPPEVIVELDPPHLEDLPVNTPNLFRLCVQQFWRLVEADEAAIGGYSGGPLMYFCERDSFLIGVMKEASLRLGGQAVATPIDTFVESVRSTAGWPSV
jgi:hypothetical protein